MKYIFLILAFLPSLVFASIPETGVNPGGSIWSGGGGNGWSVEQLLAYAEEFLLKGVLPLLVVGVALYIAYQLFSAEGDEEKMKKAFKSFTYGSIGLIAIACAYAFIAIISSISL